MRGFQGPVQKDVLESRFRTVFRVRNFGGVFGNLFQEPIFEVRFQMLVSEKRFTGACFHCADEQVGSSCL